MLSPTLYKSDLENNSDLGRIIHHLPRPNKEMEVLRRATRPLWKEMFPKEPYKLEPTIDSPHDHPDFKSKSVSKALVILNQDLLDVYCYVFRFEYDIEGAALRQKAFFYQVSLPHYELNHFQEGAISRYKMFLTLKKAHPEQFLVPCYDIDIAWHTHQV